MTESEIKKTLISTFYKCSSCSTVNTNTRHVIFKKMKTVSTVVCKRNVCKRISIVAALSLPSDTELLQHSSIVYPDFLRNIDDLLTLTVSKILQIVYLPLTSLPADDQRPTDIFSYILSCFTL